MLLDSQHLSEGQLYHAMIQTIIPRPVAWVLTDNGDGSYNLAPYSFFNGISSDPPLLFISVGTKEDGSPKDTWKNIEERDLFVVHIPHRDEAQEVTETSVSLAHGHSELQRIGRGTVPFGDFRLPRLEGSRAAIACEKYGIMTVGESDPQAMIFGRIRAIYLDDSVAVEKEGRIRVDAKKLDPLARLGGIQYAGLGDIISIPRPGV